MAFPGADLLAVLALLPAMTGAPAGASSEQGSAMILALCNGGTIAIPLDGERPVRGTVPCCAKGCHSSDRKRKLDREQ